MPKFAPTKISHYTVPIMSSWVAHVPACSPAGPSLVGSYRVHCLQDCIQCHVCVCCVGVVYVVFVYNNYVYVCVYMHVYRCVCVCVYMYVDGEMKGVGTGFTCGPALFLWGLEMRLSY